MKRSLAALVAIFFLASPISPEARAATSQAAAQKKAAKPESAPPVQSAVPLPGSHLRALKARSIGPAVMGGRISDIALDPENPFAYWVGYGTGGLMKTSNNGVSFDTPFDKESVASIGAVAVAPSDPKTVWVGSGEANDRNSSAWGNGVYLSTNAGETWTNVGLPTSKAIARIAVHPKDPKTAYVAAVGDLWSAGGERGLYKTSDSGATWKAVLQGPAKWAKQIGCGDVALDPADPNIVYAALYARLRTPWSFDAGPDATGGEDAGGIFRSGDGGATWKKLAGGLPPQMGRIGLTVFPKNPKIVYAVVQSFEGGTQALRDVLSGRGGVFRSDDGGETWTRTSRLNPRPFYFSQIRVDPEDDKRVYVLGLAVHVSEDGGKTFREDLFEKVHPDCHALAIDPRNPKRLLLGTDGGLYQSFDRAKAWQYVNNVPAGEFYRIAVDDSRPFRVCGGLQDNYSWVGPSAVRNKNGILNGDWISLGGGDGFGCAFHAADRNLVFFQSQQGSLERLDLASGDRRSLKPEAGEGKPVYRFHWNSPLVASRHDPDTLYFGGNRVFKLTAKGLEWKAISEDLTAQDPAKIMAGGSGAERYGVVYTIAESPKVKGLLWAGTDDGKLWVTSDGGARWTDLTANLPAAVRGQWISRVESSWHEGDVAYLAVDAHRTGNDAPLAYRTGDRGKSWQSVAGNLPAHGPVKVVREDPASPKLLFAGTELGLFASVDRGASWSPLGELPTVAVDDIVVHPRDRDLVIATHGRSLFVIDDIRPLEALAAAALEDLVLFEPPPAFGAYLLTGGVENEAKGVFRGENPPDGAPISFYTRDYTGEPVTITIANAAEQTVAKLKPAGTPGLNRVVWDLKASKDYVSEYGGVGKDKLVPPGEYTVTLSRGKTKKKAKLVVTIAEGIETR